VTKSGGRKEEMKRRKDIEKRRKRRKENEKKNDSTGKSKKKKNAHRRIKALTSPCGSQKHCPFEHYPLWATQIICLDKRKTKKERMKRNGKKGYEQE